MPKSSQDTIPERRTSARYSYLPWVDLICAGVPCQDWSVAGQRKGLRGQRSSLVYQFARILHELRPTWFLFENVPGLLSSNDGRDFAEVLRLFMVKCGYGIQWRVLDSQFFGVAQRRRRLFIVGRFGKPCPAEILFEPEGGPGDSQAGEEARPGLAVPLTSGVGVTGNAPGRRREDDFNLAVSRALSSNSPTRFDPNGSDYIVGTLQAHSKRHGHAMSTQQAAENGQIVETAFCLRADPGGIGQGHNTTYAIQDVRGGTRDKTNHGQGIGIREAGPMYTLGAVEQHAIAAALNSGGNNGGFRTEPGEHLVSSPSNSHGVRSFAGLPKGLDSARYRALGNAVTVNVIRWIGRRIVRYGG